MNPELIEPCPFCGHARPGTVESGTGFRVSCNGCLALGPYAPDVGRAIILWNATAERREETNVQAYRKG